MWGLECGGMPDLETGARAECHGMWYQPWPAPPCLVIISGICSLLTLIAISSYLLTLDAAKYLSPHRINRRNFVTHSDTCWINIYSEQRWCCCYHLITWLRCQVLWYSDFYFAGLVSMCVENVLVGGRNLNKFKSGDVNDKCYNTVSLSRAAEGCQDQYQQGSERNIKKC